MAGEALEHVFSQIVPESEDGVARRVAAIAEQTRKTLFDSLLNTITSD